MEFRIGNVEAAIIEGLKKNPESDLVKKVLENNKIFNHNYLEETKMEFICELENCSNKYELTIQPHQILYPKFCKFHRNSYKRKLHLEEIENKIYHDK